MIYNHSTSPTSLAVANMCKRSEFILIYLDLLVGNLLQVIWQPHTADVRAVKIGLVTSFYLTLQKILINYVIHVTYKSVTQMSDDHYKLWSNEDWNRVQMFTGMLAKQQEKGRGFFQNLCHLFLILLNPLLALQLLLFLVMFLSLHQLLYPHPRASEYDTGRSFTTTFCILCFITSYICYYNTSIIM